MEALTPKDVEKIFTMLALILRQQDEIRAMIRPTPESPKTASEVFREMERECVTREDLPLPEWLRGV